MSTDIAHLKHGNTLILIVKTATAIVAVLVIVNTLAILKATGNCYIKKVAALGYSQSSNNYHPSTILHSPHYRNIAT